MGTLVFPLQLGGQARGLGLMLWAWVWALSKCTLSFSPITDLQNAQHQDICIPAASETRSLSSESFAGARAIASFIVVRFMERDHILHFKYFVLLFSLLIAVS